MVDKEIIYLKTNSKTFILKFENYLKKKDIIFIKKLISFLIDKNDTKFRLNIKDKIVNFHLIEVRNEDKELLGLELMLYIQRKNKIRFYLKYLYKK